MTKGELRAYVMVHPNDQSAFHIFVDRFTAEVLARVCSLLNNNSLYVFVQDMSSPSLQPYFFREVRFLA
ncbi:MAG: hypothetical protein RLZZ135_2329 [Cyanobacteriota bacterium]|jgi:ethanolamine ammonia-lyase large subunit